MPWYIYNNRGVLQQPGPPDTIPVGLVTMYMSSESPTPTIPTGWLLCDGSSQLTATYPQLAAVLAYPGAPGANFNVPDLSEFFIIGESGSYPLNSTGGDDLHGHAVSSHSHSNTHTHGVTTNHTHAASHAHLDNAHQHTAGGYTLSDDTTTQYVQVTGGGNTNTPKGAGSGDPHTHNVTGNLGLTDGSPNSTSTAYITSNSSGAGTSGSAATTLQSATPPLADTGTKLPPYLNVYCIIKAVDLSGQYV